MKEARTARIHGYCVFPCFPCNPCLKCLYNKVYYFFNSLACSIYLSISIAWYERKYLSLIVVYA